MKIIEAIHKIDDLKHNTYSREDKVVWLSRMDSMVKRLLIDTHDGGEVAFTGYNADTDPETVLLIPEPFDEVYLRWMEAQIDYHNSEDDRYNNAVILFNNAYEGFKKHYTRTYMPISKGSKFIF